MYNEENNEISSSLCQIAAIHSMYIGCEICSRIEPFNDVYIYIYIVYYIYQ